MFFWGKKWQCKTENINSCRHFWVADQPQWLVDEVRSHTCTCTDVPARLCCFPAGALGAAGILIHKCSPEAHISRCISSLRNFFHKSNSSRNKPPPTKVAEIFALGQRLPHFNGSESSAKFIKRTSTQAPSQCTQSESMGLDPTSVVFTRFPPASSAQQRGRNTGRGPHNHVLIAQTSSADSNWKYIQMKHLVTNFFLMTTIIKEKWKYRFYAFTSEHQIYPQRSWFSSISCFDQYRICALYNVIKWEAKLARNLSCHLLLGQKFDDNNLISESR